MVRFGSVTAAVTVKKQLDVESTWVIKNHVFLFPKAPLASILYARHPNNPTGKWVVMRTVIRGIEPIAITYARSRTGVSFFISTMGDTCPAKRVIRIKI